MSLGQEYLVLVFLVCCGVIQVAASYGGLKGLFLFGGRRLSAVAGIGLIVAPLTWFFWDGGRNLPDTDGGIAGASQFVLFVLGGFLALVLTFSITSIVNYTRSVPSDTIDGLPSLKETTYLQALSNNIGVLWKLYRKLTRKFSSG